MKTKPLKKNKPSNKWKVVAIVSLVVNAIVALLLVIGLATPKPLTKVSASGEGYYDLYSVYYGDYNTRGTYMRSTEFYNDVEAIYQLRDDINKTSGDMITYSYDYNFTAFSSLSSDLSTYSNYHSVAFCFSASEHTLVWIHFSGEVDVYFWYGDFDSHISFLKADYSRSFNLLMSKCTLYLGDSSVYRSYTADEYFNPNLYIGLNPITELDYLWHAPNMAFTFAYENDGNNRFPDSFWIPPTYYSVVPERGYQNMSTLGCFEIPLMFESNGELFCGIRLYFDVVISYVLPDGSSHSYISDYNSRAIDGVLQHDFFYTFVGMSYCYELTPVNWLDTPYPTPKFSLKEKMVCALPISNSFGFQLYNDVEYRYYVYFLDKPLQWLSSDYKTINLCSFSETQAETQQVLRVPLSRNRFAIDYLSKAEVLAFDMTPTIPIIPGGNTGSIGNVFVLFGDAFKSLSSILSMAVLPGISIGMIMFLPLVLTIIIVIIKLVKR